jgi:hypothetical protein
MRKRSRRSEQFRRAGESRAPAAPDAPVVVAANVAPGTPWHDGV